MVIQKDVFFHNNNTHKKTKITIELLNTNDTLIIYIVKEIIVKSQINIHKIELLLKKIIKKVNKLVTKFGKIDNKTVSGRIKKYAN